MSGPITPSAGRLLAFWKLRTALVVLLPNRPSAFRAAPLRLSWRWALWTAAPAWPLLMAMPG